MDKKSKKTLSKYKSSREEISLRNELSMTDNSEEAYLAWRHQI